MSDHKPELLSVLEAKDGDLGGNAPPSHVEVGDVADGDAVVSMMLYLRESSWVRVETSGGDLELDEARPAVPQRKFFGDENHGSNRFSFAHMERGETSIHR